MSFDYAALKPFDAFEELCNPEHYHELSDDWWVIVTDIQGSTRAIQEGRYKDVNLIGAASIMALLNAVKPLDIPYVFGGDGATVCVPDSVIEEVKPTLRAARDMSEQQFGLGLRLGLVPMSVIHAAGKSVRIARFQVSPHYAQAMFDGDGLSYAEMLIKDPENDNYRIADDDREPADGDFSGLECRWQHITSPKGEMHAILVASQSHDPEQRRQCFQYVLQQLKLIYPDETDTSPVTQEHLKLTTDKKLLAGESKVRGFGKSRFGAWLYRSLLPGIVRIGQFIMRFGIGKWGQYRADLIANSDYRKFDEMLRMVMVGSSEQRQKLETCLEAAHQRGELYYGIHHADAALMTCIIFNYHQSHVHFIDGANGGYAMAARQLKAQIRAGA